MTLTRQHFQMIADTVREADLDMKARADLAASFAARLRATNANFNRSRFLSACGVEG